MFHQELEQHEIQVDSTAPESASRKSALSAGVHWAEDALRRLDDLIRQTIAQFRRRKVEEKLPVSDDETPHPIHEQIHLGRICQLGGWSAILADFSFAFVAILAVLRLYGVTFGLALLLALITGAVVTIPLVILIHAGIMFLAKRFGNPVESRERVRRWFILPAFFFVVIAILSYLAIQRLDVDSLLALQPVLSALKFAGMVVFLFFGAGLLVAAEFLLWSKTQAANYEALCTEHQRIDSKRQHWQHQLETFNEERRGEMDNPKQEDKGTLGVADEIQKTEASPNGGPVSTKGPGVSAVATKAVVLLVTAATLFTSSSCTKAPTVKAEVQHANERVTLDYVIDASGVLNLAAFEQAGVNLRNSAASIAIDQHVTDLKVYWFGANGWTPEERLHLQLPPSMRAVVDHHELGELGQLRPDAQREASQRDDKAMADASAQVLAQYRREVEKTLGPLTQDALIPAKDVQSPCTDLAGMLGRFTADGSGADKRLLVIVTDGRQNCGGRHQLESINHPRKNVAVVILIVPGTVADGREDFEFRSKQLTGACPFCVVIPYWQENLSETVSDAIKKADTYLR